MPNRLKNKTNTSLSSVVQPYHSLFHKFNLNGKSIRFISHVWNQGFLGIYTLNFQIFSREDNISISKPVTHILIGKRFIYLVKEIIGQQFVSRMLSSQIRYLLQKKHKIQ